MELSTAAGIGGLGFVTAAFVVNYFYLRARLPLPGSAVSLDDVESSFAAGTVALKRSSVIAPATWLCTTVFAAGLLSVLWRGDDGQTAWALMGFAGVLMQNATFVVVEALRFGMAAGAADVRGANAGLWGLTTVLFGFNQVFLATALLGFSIAGSGTGFLPAWLTWLGYVSAALLFVSSSAAPFNVDGTNRLGPVGLIGWLGWAAWIVGCSVELLR
ncbi:hypothetical protein GV794_21980 [Nocardia cyriacigeorgica]|uniref:DUF4386 domain-containing protein n=1 Tax=Nocardia cyriacigeorgica TaxID=135487 RepID=A0A6P1D8P2_9NOCA|nr:hypothetical protein [Nocardia cyriacigeorgica]NEW47066.1 hypothetical protein [Nocardia cyriacigeorgica]NEW58298.1 hypothetical protein [Nocardia cyriacigeorgica]